jgi:CheY-like chemotaxis protein
MGIIVASSTESVQVLCLGPSLEYSRTDSDVNAETTAFWPDRVPAEGITPIMRGKLPTATVLIVDDEPLIRWSLAQGLTEAGFSVAVAANAAEARAVLRSNAAEPLVVVLDLRLPEVTDLSLLREIRAKWPESPVVMMSAQATAEDVSHAMEMGAFGFVDKPFDLPEMVKIVHAAWQGRL